MSLNRLIATSGHWFWLGSQGWGYLDLGRLWQILLTFGMTIWLVILIRGMQERLKGEHPGNCHGSSFTAPFPSPSFVRPA